MTCSGSWGISWTLVIPRKFSARTPPRSPARYNPVLGCGRHATLMPRKPMRSSPATQYLLRQAFHLILLVEDSPTMSRPPESTSIDDSDLARSTGLRCPRIRTATPRRNRSVIAVAGASVVTVSSTGAVPITCSVHHAPTNGSSSRPFEESLNVSRIGMRLRNEDRKFHEGLAGILKRLLAPGSRDR